MRARTIAGVLADVLADPGRLGEPVPAAVLHDARAHLAAVADDVAVVGGWTEAEPLRLAKGPVTWLVRCPRRALAPASTGDPDDLALGLVVDAAAKLATLGTRRPATVDMALGFLAAHGDTFVADHLDALRAAPPVGSAHDPAGRLLAEAAARVERLVAGWPAIDPTWWPRVEDPVRVRLAGGAVTISGRLDVLLGGPPTGRPGVVVEVKAGRWYDGMRADAHLYALLVGLRDGEAPAVVVTVAADGTTQVEPVRPAVVHHAAERVELALRTAARLAAGEVPEARPGSQCGHCPLRAGCQPGERWLADRAAQDDAA